MNKALIIGCIGLLQCASSLALPYPSEVNKWNSTDKIAQREAGDNFMKMLDDAIAAGKKELSVPKGVYRFNKTTQPGQPVHIVLRAVKDLSIDGNGSWFYFENQASAFRLINCNNIVIRNINIDYDPLPYVQGTVISVNDENPRSFVFKPAAGYTMPTLLLKNEVPGRSLGKRRIIVWDKDTRLIKADQVGMDIKRGKDSITPLEDGSYRIDTWVWWGKSLKDAGVRIGQPVTLLRRAGRVIRIEVCEHIAIDNVDIYAGGFVGYVGYQGKGPLTFTRCDIKRRPDTDRLLSSNADGFNIRGTLKGATIENCSAEAIGDDGVNLQGVYHRVFAQVSPTELIVASTPDTEGPTPTWHFINGEAWTDPEQPNKKDLQSWAHIATVSVVSKENTNYIVPKSSAMHKWAAAKNYTPGTECPALKVTLSAPIKVDANDIFWSEEAVVRGSVIRNNVFHNTLARGIRLQTIDCLVEGNRISSTTDSSLTLAGQPGYWGESANCQNVIIRNNHFEDSGRCSGNAAITMKVEGNPTVAEPITKIRIENNRIVNPRGSAIELSGCDDVRITQNSFSGLSGRTPIVKGRGLKNITIKANSVK
jgi:hypothetical protein